MRYSSMIQRAVDEGAAVLIGNVFEGGNDARPKSVVLHQIASAMCAPIQGRSDVLGAMYLDSKITGTAFEDGDLELLTTVAAHAGLAHDNHRLASESARAERLAAIGTVVAGLAHDIRNYVLGLSLGQDVVDMEIQEKFDDGGKRAWQSMKEAQNRITDLAQDMLAYSKPREPDWQLVDASQIAAAAVKAVERRADRRGVRLECAAVPQLPSFWFDAKGIERCLINLAANGVDATQKGGTVTVRVARGGPAGTGGSPGGGQSKPDSEAQTEGMETVEFSVADTGTGIPPDARSQVFDLFFSTKKSKGTGLGLAVSRKVVEEHGGSISFTTEVDEGTTFTIALPMRLERPE